MHKKIFHLTLVALLITSNVGAKRSRRIKRPKDDEESTPQPNVVTYSTFGFKDVGAYDGFVPSSPDYATYLSKYNQDSSTRLYAPAFPTAQDSTGPGNYGSQSLDEQQQSNDGEPQASMLQFQQNSISFYNSPSDENNSRGQNQEIYSRNEGEGSAPIYGAKIGSKGRAKYPFNHTADFSGFGEDQAASNNQNKFASFHEVYNSKQPVLEQTKNYQNNFNYATNYQSSDNEDHSVKSGSINTQSALKFPKVIDFTKYKQYYPTDLDTNKYLTTTPFPSYGPASNTQNENIHSQSYSNAVFSFNNAFTEKDGEEKHEKQVAKPNSYNENDYSQNYYGQSYKGALNSIKSNPPTDLKDKFKYKPLTPTNYTNDFKTWKNPVKGYQFSSDVSNTSFEFDFSADKKPFSGNNDEIVPASSNIVDLSSYRFPEHDYSSFKKIPGTKDSFDEDYSGGFQSYKHLPKYDPEDYVRSLYSTVPTTTTQWGNVYKPSKYSSYKHHSKKPHFQENSSDDIVHIPKRPYSSKYGVRYTDAKPSEWAYNSYKPYKPKKPAGDWAGEFISSNRFKSEEDLLGLRNHDTSHPSYLPTYKPYENSLVNDYNDYKKLVEKWRQSYLKAKYKDAYSQDFESYPSEQRPVHVPVPKPYPIEVPHPVIVPVPQPYPVRVPIAKPVAVPVVQELTVPVEKPVPYPVIKKVPYPIEKPVPVRVEKEVQVPVIKPYPVHVPHIKPVFHHTRPREDYDAAIDVDEEEDYMPRQESSKRVPYAKRIKSPRSRTRRPSRTYSYQERSRRRWPSTAHRPSDVRSHRPSSAEDLQYPRPYRQRDQEFRDEHDHTDYFAYCKRTGNC